ncbi:MAG: leucine-rich repeat domain-containing protein [Clostridia bacterium]|nr:leucine-rich repeat domain-containing protein [Clostridia bacterium]
MKTILKRTLAVFIAIVMLATTVVPAFAESEESNVNTQTDVKYEATNVLGELILDNAESKQEENTEYLIQSVSIEGTTATVDLKNSAACYVVVAVFEQKGKKMLASGKADVDAKEYVDDDTVTVEIEIDEMPDYFYVKAFLVDESNVPLCKSYETNEYTKEYEEFIQKTTADFDADRVINLDEKKDNNFLVVSDDATIVEFENGTNTVVTDDYANGVYVIENADEQVKNLKKDDIFYYKYGSGESEYIIIKVDKVQINEDTVTLTASKVESISELFQFIKIDETSTDSVFDETEMADGVTHESVAIAPMGYDINIDGSMGAVEKWAIQLELSDNIEIAADITGNFTFGLKIFYDVLLFGDDYFYIELTATSGFDVSVAVTGKIDCEIPLGKVGFNFFGSIKAEVPLNFIFEAEAELSLSWSLAEVVVGFSYDSNTGEFVNKNKTSALEYDHELEIKVKFFAGFELKPEAKVLDWVEISVSARAGLEVNIEPLVLDPEEAVHDCGTCLDIDFYLVTSQSVSAKFFDIFNKKTVFGNIKLLWFSAYYSDSFGFGLDNCPNIRYAVNIYVTDEKRDPLSDVVINDEYKTDENGMLTIYLASGIHTITAKFENGEVRTETVKIVDKKVTVYISKNDSGVYKSGKCGDDIIWMLYNDGELVINGSGSMTDWNSIESVVWYPYASYIKKVLIGNGIDTISKYSFYACENLVDVIVGDNVSIIGNAAFQHCSNLVKIDIPNSVEKISMNAFFKCKNLTEINIPDTVSVIGPFAFYECGFTSITLPNSVKIIEEYLFGDCRNLINIEIPSGVTDVEEHAFGGCIKLESITIPSSVTAIEDYAFDCCDELEYVFFEGTKEQWDEISIGTGNECLVSATIFCKGDAPFELMSVGYSIPAQDNTKTKIVNDATIGNNYLMVAVKDENADDLLSSDNILYIDQKTAESENLTFEYVLDEDVTEYSILVFGAKLLHYHLYEIVETSPTCTAQGYTTYTCYCGDTYTGANASALSHTEESISGTPADCTNDGLTDGIKCSVCNTKLTAQEVILATGHVNENGDSKCDSCGYDLSADCSHICHSSNAFMKFFWQIALFFSKLFNIQANRYCDCGIAHW